MSWENLIYLADFLQLSGERTFNLLGGEPTLHPEFIGFVIYLLERDFEIKVFTCGIMPGPLLEETAAAFQNIPQEKLSFILNLNHPDKSGMAEMEKKRSRSFMRIFGQRITPGFTIYRADYRLDFLFRLINAFGLKKTLRLGLAHPIVGAEDMFIQIDDMEVVIDRLFSYIPKFERFRIKPALGCGFPMCKVKDHQLAWLYRHTGGGYDFNCAPVIDIGPDMMVGSCFPLSSFQRRSLFEFNSLGEIRDFYGEIHEKIKIESGGIYLACDSCHQRRDNLCKGGCLAHNLNTFHEEPRLRMPEVYL